MKLSILICSLESRKHLLDGLLAGLNSQISRLNASDEVEISVDIDKKQISTGAKRQLLLNRAKGDYIVFIDDDDWVPDYYIQEMLTACDSGMDCFAMNGTYQEDDKPKEVVWFLSKDNANENKNGYFYRRTNHITGVKRELALLAGFPNISNGEDAAYSNALNGHLKTEYKIDKPMYKYRFSTKNKEY